MRLAPEVLTTLIAATALEGCNERPRPNVVDIGIAEVGKEIDAVTKSCSDKLDIAASSPVIYKAKCNDGGTFDVGDKFSVCRLSPVKTSIRYFRVDGTLDFEDAIIDGSFGVTAYTKAYSNIDSKQLSAGRLYSVAVKSGDGNEITSVYGIDATSLPYPYYASGELNDNGATAKELSQKARQGVDDLKLKKERLFGKHCEKLPRPQTPSARH